MTDSETLTRVVPRYIPEWSGWPNGPWIIRDRTTGAAYRKPHKSHFWHGQFDTAVSMSDALNRKA